MNFYSSEVQCLRRSGEKNREHRVALGGDYRMLFLVLTITVRESLGYTLSSHFIRNRRMFKQLCVISQACGSGRVQMITWAQVESFRSRGLDRWMADLRISESADPL